MKKRSNLSPPSQATIMVFQAVAEYRINVKEIKQLDLEMTIRVEGSRQPIVWKFSKENSHLAQTEKVSLWYKVRIHLNTVGYVLSKHKHFIRMNEYHYSGTVY